MSRAIIKLFAAAENDFINLEADKFEMTEDNIIVIRQGEIVAVFALTEVRAAYLSQKAKENRNV